MSGIVLASIGLTYASAPVNTSLPVISGTARAGQTLSVSTGSWVGQPAPTYTYQWQEGTTNISGATSNTYALDLDDVGSTFRCIVTATNSEGSASATSASTSAVAVPSLGASIAGGYYAGQISTSGNGTATHYLIVAPMSSGYDFLQYGNSYGGSGIIYNCTSRIDGPTNTSLLDTEPSIYDAAAFCAGLSIGGYSDWYLPAVDELEVCYYNLKPTTDSNNTSFGANNYSVPKRTTNYTTTVPGRTSATDFISGNSQAFDGVAFPIYSWWSSTFAYENIFFEWYCYGIAFKDISSGPTSGTQVEINHLNYANVRAVRRVAV